MMSPAKISPSAAGSFLFLPAQTKRRTTSLLASIVSTLVAPSAASPRPGPSPTSKATTAIDAHIDGLRTFIIGTPFAGDLGHTYNDARAPNCAREGAMRVS